MKLSFEKKFILYISLFIAILLNSYRLTALKENSVLAAYWAFNGTELLFETAWNFVFCLLATFTNLWLPKVSLPKYIRWLVILIANLILLKFFTFFGVLIQQKVFLNITPDQQFRAGYFIRLLISFALAVILIQIIFLLRKNKQHETENEQLRNAYTKAQLELLKEELNPHFLFNALSSLSAVVSENPERAQQYIAHLAKIFRYTLSRQEKNMVSLKDELAIFQSFAALQKLRLEDNIRISVQIPDDLLQAKLPYMSLQPLLENAVKHNSATHEKPLQVSITADMEFLKIENNIQPLLFTEESTSTGLANLNERFMILMKKPVVIIQSDAFFTVKLPLQNNEN